MLTDPVSDLLARIKNAYLSRGASVMAPWSRPNERLVALLCRNNFLDSYEAADSIGKKQLHIKLKYTDHKPAVSGLKRISKPSLRVYVRCDRLPRRESGIAVVSTAKGLMTTVEARAAGVGGEIWCYIW